jgi:hypothetical protein
MYKSNHQIKWNLNGRRPWPLCPSSIIYTLCTKLRLLTPAKSAVQSDKTDCVFQCSSNLVLNKFILSAATTFSGRLFHMLITLLVKKCFLKSYLTWPWYSRQLLPLVWVTTCFVRETAMYSSTLSHKGDNQQKILGIFWILCCISISFVLVVNFLACIIKTVNPIWILQLCFIVGQFPV